MDKYSAANSGSNLTLVPNSGTCYDLLVGQHKTRKTVWFVPHVIKYRDESYIVVWRCNWGNACESDCLYAMAKDKTAPALNSATVTGRI